MFGLYYATWEKGILFLVDTFDNYDEADNRRLTLESRYGTDEGYYLVMEV